MLMKNGRMVSLVAINHWNETACTVLVVSFSAPTVPSATLRSGPLESIARSHLTRNPNQLLQTETANVNKRNKRRYKRKDLSTPFGAFWLTGQVVDSIDSIIKFIDLFD